MINIVDEENATLYMECGALMCHGQFCTNSNRHLRLISIMNDAFYMFAEIFNTLSNINNPPRTDIGSHYSVNVFNVGAHIQENLIHINLLTMTGRMESNHLIRISWNIFSQKTENICALCLYSRCGRSKYTIPHKTQLCIHCKMRGKCV